MAEPERRPRVESHDNKRIVVDFATTGGRVIVSLTRYGERAGYHECDEQREAAEDWIAQPMQIHGRSLEKLVKKQIGSAGGDPSLSLSSNQFRGAKQSQPSRDYDWEQSFRQPSGAD
jgi:hypothetical protein